MSHFRKEEYLKKSENNIGFKEKWNLPYQSPYLSLISNGFVNFGR
jgi:hypothetical protein